MDCVERIERARDRAEEVFGERLNEAMRRRGVTPKRIRNETGIKYGTISGYRYGKGNPTMRNLVALCEVLDVPADYLLGRDSGWR